MGFFSKRKNENNGFIINTDDEPIKISGDKNLAPHAMTADEISGLWVLGDDEQPVTKTSALDSLKKRMNVSEPVTPKNEKVELPDTMAEQEPKAESQDVNAPVVTPLTSRVTTCRKTKSHFTSCKASLIFLKVAARVL